MGGPWRAGTGELELGLCFLAASLTPRDSPVSIFHPQRLQFSDKCKSSHSLGVASLAAVTSDPSVFSSERHLLTVHSVTALSVDSVSPGAGVQVGGEEEGSSRGWPYPQVFTFR